MQPRHSLIAGLSLLTALTLTACGGAGGETADAHDLALPGDLASEVPMPAEASIQTSVEPEPGIVSVVFSPGMPYGEARDFFADALDGSDWTIIDENLREADEGEVSSNWTLEGHGVEVWLSLTGFGGDDASMVSGSLIVEE